MYQLIGVLIISELCMWCRDSLSEYGHFLFDDGHYSDFNDFTGFISAAFIT